MKNQRLHLTLKRVWFDAIARGEKREEYRTMSPHWRARLENAAFAEIHFRNGYSKDAPTMLVECLGMTRGQWEEKPCFVLKLGKILEVRNYESHPTATAASEKLADPQAESPIPFAEADGQS
jgi:hypothetical protein